MPDNCAVCGQVNRHYPDCPYYRHKLRGERVHSARLSPEKALRIRAQLSERRAIEAEIAACEVREAEFWAAEVARRKDASRERQKVMEEQRALKRKRDWLRPKQLAAEFGVETRTIRAVEYGESWTNLDMERER